MNHSSQPTSNNLKAHIVRFEPKIISPVPEISFKLLSSNTKSLKITLHFSRLKNGNTPDLEFEFQQPLAFQWEDESFGLIGLPEKLPQCESIEYAGYAYPVLTIEPSVWADQYSARMFTEEEYEANHATHYAFVAMNDLVHVLSIEKPIIKWIDSSE